MSSLQQQSVLLWITSYDFLKADQWRKTNNSQFNSEHILKAIPAHLLTLPRNCHITQLGIMICIRYKNIWNTINLKKMYNLMIHIANNTRTGYPLFKQMDYFFVCGLVFIIHRHIWFCNVLPSIIWLCVYWVM